jgi:hypothetical protein
MDQTTTFFGVYHGFEVHEHKALGHLWVWGADARAIEVYPADSQVVNSINCRHLWRLGESDFAPDLLGDVPDQDTLAARFASVWSEATGVPS